MHLIPWFLAGGVIGFAFAGYLTYLVRKERGWTLVTWFGALSAMCVMCLGVWEISIYGVHLVRWMMKR
jgi:hypothetical protein